MNKNNLPSVSVIIPSYNTAGTIGRTVESIVETRYPNLQVIIVDDGSKDNSLQVIQEIIRRFSFVELYTHPGNVNKGIAATRNLAIEKSAGKYIAFVDADDIFLPNRFDICIPKMESDPSINMIYEPYQCIHESGKRSEAMRNNQNEELLSDLTDEQLFMKVLRGTGVPHTTSVTLRRTALINTDLFPPLKYCLEKPLWLKLYCLGGVKPGSTEPVSAYYLHENSTCAKYEDTRAFRFEDVQAYLNVYRWMVQQNITGTMREAVKNMMVGKYMHYTTYSRSLKGRYFKDILCAPFTVLRAYPPIGLNLKFWWASTRMILGLSNGTAD